MATSKTATPFNPFAHFAQAPAAKILREALGGERIVLRSGISVGAQPFLAALAHYFFPERLVVVVTAGVKLQESFLQDIETWRARLTKAAPSAEQTRVSSPAPQTPVLSRVPPASAVGPASALYFPSWEVLPHDDKLPHADVISERLETLVALIKRDSVGLPPFLITNVAACLQRTYPPDWLRERTRSFQRGDRIDPLDLVEWLEDQGYEPETQVNHKGEIALRGGILDVFPLSQPWPVRLEFFGDEIESIRQFDPINQMSTAELDRVVFPPGGEIALLKRMVREGETAGDGAGRQLATLADYLPEDALIVLCEPQALEEQAEHLLAQVSPEDRFFSSWEEVKTQFAAPGRNVLVMGEHLESTGVVGTPGAGAESDSIDFLGGAGTASGASEELICGGLDTFRATVDRPSEAVVAEAQRREFFHQLHRWLRQGFALHVFFNNDGERQRFGEIWEEYGLGGAAAEAGAGRRGAAKRSARSTAPAMERPLCHLGALTRGFLCEAARMVVVTDAEIFGRYKVLRPRRLKSPHAQASRSLLDIDFSDLQEGDYVVHLQHGIGRYLGLTRLPLGGGMKPLEKSAALSRESQECLIIEYAPTQADQPPPRLYVPVSEAHLVGKYVGAGKSRPPLHTLGGNRWRKAREEAEHAVRDFAAELLALQAQRDSLPGHACGPDTPWQREFEGAFLYEETPDQMRAIVQAKADLERAKPMDRLICGDVGYGKTEVAIRAAFKMVMEGKQVAVLVPTTVLAQQHYNNFAERMADYPIRVELLSRFRSARQQAKVLQDLAAGAVDIVIGTHRLIQNDVAFKDLGLVVVDEEQRFGVMHKEKFKLMRRLVDVLTLSATPIPRTLHLALMGARDMSTIETPPQDRLPVETIVCDYDERVIRDAIVRELNRQGQVFYLHNRIFDIENVAQRLRVLVPQARVVVGHGQMHADDLEEVMTTFINGQADVLLSTTIIESGLDIPNANTIIIERADRFGLSDLYQLRGRVGRYKHQAYAYLLIPRHARMLTDARKRMSAIKQYSTLGSGFKIAMRDLEIRGAGNLLGSQQSGHITAVGFDLYCQLLKQSIGTLKGEQLKPRVEVQVRLDFLSLNPGEPEGQAKASPPRTSKGRMTGKSSGAFVPREVATCVSVSASARETAADDEGPVRRAYAYVPLSYVPDERQRISIYRRVAELTVMEEIVTLTAELRDRFGPLPDAVELLLQLAGLKILASEKQVSILETKGDKLMLTRQNDYVTVGGRFPRLVKKEPQAKLKEIGRLLRAL